MERILILNDYGGRRGGAEVVSYDLRRLLRDRGIDARLMTSTADPWQAPEDEPDYSCFGSNGRFRALVETANPSAYREVRRALQEFRPQLVQVMMFMTQLSPSILAALRDVPVVYAAHTYRAICPTGMRYVPGEGICERMAGAACNTAGCFSAVGLLPRRLQLELLRRQRRRINVTVAPSRAMAEFLERHGWPVGRVIPHAVPPYDRTLPLATRPLFAFAGRLVAEKGVDRLLQAFAIACRERSDLQLDIAGDGPVRPALEAMAVALGIADQTRFLGHLRRAETQARLEPAWAQLVPSLWVEPFGLVAAEAMMRGTAVICSDTGAPREIVRDGETGYVIANNDPTAMAAALLRIAGDRSLAERMGARGRAIAAMEYSEERWIDDYLDAYASVIAAHDAGCNISLHQAAHTPV